MAFTRKMLKSMGLTDEQVDTLIEAHSETVQALKDQIEKFKTDAEKVPELQKQVDDLKKNDGYKEKYEKEHSDFESYKNDVAAKETRSNKTEAFKAVLKKAGIADKYVQTVVKASAAEIDALELDDKGNAKDEKTLSDSLKSNWADFVGSETVKGSKVDNPPKNVGGSMTKEQIMQIADRAERRAAIANNMELFSGGKE